MKIKFTMEWTEELTDEQLKEYANENLLEENEEFDRDAVLTTWLDDQVDKYEQSPGDIPDVGLSIDYEVLK